MKIRINQAIYGERNNAHTLLEHTFLDSKIPKDVTLKTDLPSGHGSFPSWNHFYSAIGYESHYIIMKIFPDTKAQRSNFVYTHALFINKDDLAHVDDIDIIFRLFPKTLDKGLEIQPAEIEIESNTGRKIMEATKKVAYGILSNNTPVIWLGQEGFLNTVKIIWNNLWPYERFNFQFRVSFGPKDIENTKEQLIYTPESLKDKWEGHFVVRMNDSFEEKYTESIAYLIEGPEKAPSIRAIAHQLEMSVSSIKRLKELSLLSGLLQEKNFNNLLNAITLIQRLAPSVKQGYSLKLELITRLAEILKSGSLEKLLALRNLSNEHVGGFSIVSDAVKTVLTKNFYSSEQAAHAIDILYSLNRVPKRWWLETVRDFLGHSMETWKGQHAKFFCNIVSKDHKALNVLKNYIPSHSNVESSIIENVPVKIDNELLKTLIDFSKDQKWLSFHALLCAMAFEPQKALDEQLLIDTNPQFIDAISILSKKVPATSFISFSVASGDPRLVQLSSGLTEKKPRLLDDIDMTNAVWREIWQLRTENGVEPFKGLKNPKIKVFDLMDRLLKGEQVGETLLLPISKSKHASLLHYRDRKYIWTLLQSDVRQQFIEATALDWLDGFLSKTEKELIELEQVLEKAVFNEKLISSLFYESRYKCENILLLLDKLPTLSESTFIKFLTTRATDFDINCCQRIGQIIKTKRWSNSYRKVKLELLAKNNAFIKTIEVCKGMFPLIDNPWLVSIGNFFSGSSKSEYENKPNQNTMTEKKKAVILTAIEVEYKAVKSFVTNYTTKTHPLTGSIYGQATYNDNWDILIIETEAGNNNAAIEAERAISYFNPEYVLFVGVAGGLKDVKIGDVVVASKVYGIESAKADKELLPRHEFGQPTHRIKEIAKSLRKDDEWLTQTSQQIESMINQKFELRAFFKPIVAGEKVVSSSNSPTYKYIKKNAGDALAVEMEGIGFLKACYAHENKQYILIRGISDLVDNKSQTDSAGGQELASLTAAAFAFEMLNRIEKS